MHSHSHRGVAKQTSLSYPSVEDPVKHSRLLCGHPGKPTLARRYCRCCLLGYSFLLRDVAVVDCVGGGPLGELQKDVRAAFSACHGQVLWSARARQSRQGSAGMFGICSYQQERSALQSLQGEGGEREWEGGWSGSREAWTEMEEKLENWLLSGQINLSTQSGCFDPTESRMYIQYPACEVLSVLKH